MSSQRGQGHRYLIESDVANEPNSVVEIQELRRQVELLTKNLERMESPNCLDDFSNELEEDGDDNDEDASNGNYDDPVNDKGPEDNSDYQFYRDGVCSLVDQKTSLLLNTKGRQCF